MSVTLAFVVFPVCLAGIVAGSIWLDRGLEAMGSRLNLLPGLLGLISAFGADSPEITSAISAMLAGRHQASVGVVIGSNLFNLAGLTGLGAVLAGSLPVQRAVTAFNAIVSLVATVIIVLLVRDVFGAAFSISLLGAMLVLYVIALAVRADSVRSLAGDIGAVAAEFLYLVHQHADRKNQRQKTPARVGPGGWRLILLIAASLLMIVLGSYGIVHSSLRIGRAWGISDEIIGSLILAPLTGFPNVYTSAMLALRANGAAVVSETLNSNTINMIVGISVPAMVFGVPGTPIANFELWWLLALTVLVAGFALWRARLVRWMGGVIIAGYLCFIAARLLIF